MRIALNIVGVILVLLGILWVLQGTNIVSAGGHGRPEPMDGDRRYRRHRGYRRAVVGQPASQLIETNQ